MANAQMLKYRIYTEYGIVHIISPVLIRVSNCWMMAWRARTAFRFASASLSCSESLGIVRFG
jgi:hypothetical protein